MKNITFTMFSVAVATLVGCGEETSDLEQRIDGVYTIEDVNVLPSDEAESLPMVAQVQSDSDPTLNDDEQFGLKAADDPSERKCWVILHWCDDPDGGGATCSSTGCQKGEVLGHCLDLIDENC